VAFLHCHCVNRKAAFSMSAYTSTEIPHHMAQIASAQRQLAGLHIIDPSSSAGPGTPSVTTTDHASVSIVLRPPMPFPVPKDAETPLHRRNAAWLSLAA